MKPSAREFARSVPAVTSADAHGGSHLCLSSPNLGPSSPYRLPESDAAIRLGTNFQVSKVPAYEGSSCTDTCKRGDQLVSLAEVKLSLARSTACRITAAALHKPGVRLDLVKGEWLSVPRRRRKQPRCRTFGCSLPDLHAGLHQVAHDSSPLTPAKASAPARPPRRWRARFASDGWCLDVGLTRWVCGARRWRALPSVNRPCKRASSAPPGSGGRLVRGT